MEDCISYFILVSKLSGTIIREFTVDFSRIPDYDFCEECVLRRARIICDECGIPFDDVYIYERCYFKD